jgi:putative addiction module antidote
MAKQVKIVKVGNSAGVILPKEVLAHLHVAPGDELYLRETPSGFALSAVDPDFVEAMTAAEAIMREDRDILAVLAK